MSLLPKQLSQSIDDIARTALGPEWTAYATLYKNWAEIIGNDLADQVKLTKIVLQPHGEELAGVVTIAVPRGLAMEMQYRLHIMRRRMNTFFGYEAITRINIEHQTSS